MNFFFILNGKRVKQTIIIIVAAFFTASIFYVENIVQQPVFSTKNGPRAIYKGDSKEKKIALTFDISWGDEKATPILDTLKKEGITNTTFFLSAVWAEQHPNIVKRIVDDGHEIGSKGYKYVDYTKLEDQQIRKDISHANEVFKKLGVKNITLLRTPTGSLNQNVISIAEKLGLTVVHWSIDSQDWTNPGVAKVTENVLNKLHKGDIILLHASDSAIQTNEALPQIIRGIKEEELSFGTVSDLISNAEVKSKEVK